MTSQSPSKWAPWDLTQFSQSPSAALPYFPEFLSWSEFSFVSKVILALGKARSHTVPNVGRLSHLGDLMLCQKTLHRMWWMSGMLLWWSCQSPVAHSYSLLHHPNSVREGMFKLNATFDAESLLYSLSHFWVEQPHSTHAHWTATTIPTVYPVPLAAWLHQCCTNHSLSINNGWSVSGYIYMELFKCIHIHTYMYTHRHIKEISDKKGFIKF